MKKIIFFVGIILLFCSNAFAGLHIDAAGAFNGAGDAKYQGGGTWGIFYGLNDNINIGYKGSYTLAKLDAGPVWYNTPPAATGYFDSTRGARTRDYTQMMHLFEVEYIYHFQKLPLAIKGTLGIGLSSLDIDYKKLNTNSGYTGAGTISNPYMVDQEWEEDPKNDKGLGLGLWVGVSYHATQYIAPFLDFGYVYSYYGNEHQDKSVHGISAVLGLRFSIIWKNRGLLDEY